MKQGVGGRPTNIAFMSNRRSCPAFAGSLMVETGEILSAGGLQFGFGLCAKPEQFGNQHVAHFWMPTKSLYGQRNTPAPNLEPLANYFWTRCLLERTHSNPDNQEIFILARLCPLVRSHAAQRIGTDARSRRKNPTTSAKMIESLDEILRTPPNPAKGESDCLTPQEFHEQTLPSLSRSHGAQELEAYREISRQLFDDELRHGLEEGVPAADLAVPKWNLLNQRYGRRSRRPLLRQAMDVLSFEARAAVRRCYSCVWNDLIPQLAQKFNLSPATSRFLRYMHLECRIPIEGATDGAEFNLYHSQVLALHPAMSMMIQTSTGRQLIGEFLECDEEGTGSRSFQKLLRAFRLSLYYYETDRDENRRTTTPDSLGELDLTDHRKNPDEDETELLPPNGPPAVAPDPPEDDAE
jgi:hypothetical protein